MSRDGTGREGVTNHRGQVYTGHGSEVYPGLVCCDASVIPTSLGKSAKKLLDEAYMFVRSESACHDYGACGALGGACCGGVGAGD